MTAPDGKTETAFHEKELVLEGERADDLQLNGLRLIQSPAAFCFSTDSVLLEHFAAEGMRRAGKRSRGVDLGAGSGFLSVTLNARTGVPMTAVELDKEQCGRLRRSLLLNGIPEDAVRVVNGDLTDRTLDAGGPFDLAVCNPPYFTADQPVSKNSGATHGTAAGLAEFAAAAKRLLKYGGRLYMCCPASRLAEALTALSANGLEPKLLRLVQTSAEKKPYLALIRANRGAKPGVTVERNLVIMGSDGNYTGEVRSYYDD